MQKGILERLSEGVVLGDGGYIVELERRGYVVAGAFTPELSISHPPCYKNALAGSDRRRLATKCVQCPG